METEIENGIKEKPVENDIKTENFIDIQHSFFVKDESFHSLNYEIEYNMDKENYLLVPGKTKVTEDNLDHSFHCLHEGNMLEVNPKNFNYKETNGEGQVNNKRNPKTETNKKKQGKLTKKKSEKNKDSYDKPISQRSSKDLSLNKRRKHVFVDGLSLERRRTTRSMAPEVDDPNVLEKNEKIINTKATRSVTPKVLKKYDELVTGTSVKKLLNMQKAQDLTAFQSKLLKKFDSSINTEEDSDKMFLLSLLPFVKNLNDDEKLNFRFCTLQFFKDIRRKTRPLFVQ